MKKRRIISAIFTILTITGASTAHGRDWITKGLLLAATCILLPISGWLLATWGGAVVGLVAALLFWFTYRTGRQAKAELDLMYGVHGATRRDIAMAYVFPCGLSAALIAGSAIYAQAWWYLALVPACFAFIWVPMVIASRTGRMWTELLGTLTVGAPNAAYVLLAGCEAARRLPW